MNELQEAIELIEQARFLLSGHFDVETDARLKDELDAVKKVLQEVVNRNFETRKKEWRVGRTGSFALSLLG